MSVDENTAWTDLRRRLEREQARELSLEEAERRLATGGDEPLTETRIEDIVRQAAGEVGGARPAAPRHLTLLRFASRVAAAAIVSGALVFVAFRYVHSGLATDADRTPRNLSSDAAVEQLLDPSASASERKAALLGLQLHALFAVSALKNLSASQDTVGVEAEQALKLAAASLDEAAMPPRPINLGFEREILIAKDSHQSDEIRIRAVRDMTADVLEVTGLIRGLLHCGEPILEQAARDVLGNIRNLLAND